MMARPIVGTSQKTAETTRTMFRIALDGRTALRSERRCRVTGLVAGVTGFVAGLTALIP
jgi:hypothetical protein